MLTFLEEPFTRSHICERNKAGSPLLQLEEEENK